MKKLAWLICILVPLMALGGCSKPKATDPAPEPTATTVPTTIPTAVPTAVLTAVPTAVVIPGTAHTVTYTVVSTGVFTSYSITYSTDSSAPTIFPAGAGTWTQTVTMHSPYTAVLTATTSNLGANMTLNTSITVDGVVVLQDAQTGTYAVNSNLSYPLP